MKQATLCFLIRENRQKKELLLAMKKRDFGKGKWNGVGGKMNKKRGDRTIEDTAVRETREEIKVEIQELEKVAILSFDFPYSKDWNQDVHVFITKKWEREPKETEEVKPQWFPTDKIPFDKMWDDDKFWLPLVLKGKRVRANFVFKEGEIVISHDIKVVEKLN